MDGRVRAEAAVILCAGGSRRMGRSKGLLLLDARPLLRHQVDAFQPFADRVVVVLGPEPALHRAVLPPQVEILQNPRWSETSPADSLHLALRALPPLKCAFISPVDVPPPSADLLHALLASPAPALPTDPRGQPGHPVLLDAALLAHCRATPPPGGLRTLLAHAHRVPTPDPWVSQDFDTPEAWQAFISRRRSG